MKQKHTFAFVLPLLVAAVFAGAVWLDIFHELDFYIYDKLLGLRPRMQEDPSILFLEVDDAAIDYVGVWPWSRDVMADGLFLMKELGSRAAVFDIEYVQPSPRGVNQEYLMRDIPETLDSGFATINDNISDLFGAIKGGSIALSHADDYVEQLKELNLHIQDDLESGISRIARDNDTYLGDASRFFENAFFTVTMIDEDHMIADPDYHDWVTRTLAYPRVRGDLRTLPAAHGIIPAIPPVLQSAAGAGFPNIIVDSDGVRRRIHLFYLYGEHVFPQLVMSPLLDAMGRPELNIDGRFITIVPDDGSPLVRIPVNADGTVLINWSGNIFEDSFRHFSFFHLALYQKQEQELVENLYVMDRGAYFSYYEGKDMPLDILAYAESLKDDIVSGRRPYDNEYPAVRQLFFDTVGDFLDGDTRDTILSIIEDILAAPDYSEDEKNSYRDVRTEVETNFRDLASLYQDLVETRERVREAVDGSFVIIGASATSTTDWGVNPFERKFANMGTHGAILNMIFQNSFITERSRWYAFAFAIILLSMLSLAIPRINPGPGLLAGFASLFLLLSGVAAVFLLTGVYFPGASGFIALAIGFIALFVTKLLVTSKEKVFIRRAFNYYLSTDVINEILKDPAKLALGGEKKFMTAMFTDVKGFSTISESMDPTDLVSLLNAYLTDMSDIILDVQGTIDKFEGDAIISFYGAPVSTKDHAERACRAAVRMARAEAELNRRFLDEGLLSAPLFTRIGINTGDMVVGNMGTATRMDYTIMGNAVNLAARLEGVNKQYNSRILVSDMTRKELKDRFLLRQLDRVRVVGIQTPVRLFEVVEEEGAAEQKLADMLGIFNEGLRVFEEKDWKGAEKAFLKCLDLYPGDGPSGIYVRRCRENEKTPPPASWDGVFNLSVK